MAKKRNKTEQKEETKFQIFIRNYKTNQAFRSLVKLGGYIVFIFVIFISYQLFVPTYLEEQEENKTTTNVQESSKTYKEILDELSLSKITYNYSITEGETIYIITGNIEESIMTGYLETTDNTIKFKIKDNIIYKTNLNADVETPELFGNLDISVIEPTMLVNKLLSNGSTKEVKEDVTNYNYNIDGVTITVSIKNEHVSEITYTTATTTYKLTYTY